MATSAWLTGRWRIKIQPASQSTGLLERLIGDRILAEVDEPEPDMRTETVSQQPGLGLNTNGYSSRTIQPLQNCGQKVSPAGYL